jgi:SAM-dependent methyltransferase
MGHATMLRKMFPGITLCVEDLLLLESFQVRYLPERVPQKAFAAIIQTYPFIKNYLILRDPSIQDFINSVLSANEEIKDKNLIERYTRELLWEIADLIIYNKFPEIYDQKSRFTWHLDEIIPIKSLEHKIVADVGAGSGMLSFLLAKYATTVYAIEPITSFRCYIRQKAEKEKVRNVYPIDGFLDSIPFPDNTFDVLFTSNAMGWNITKELQEIERVVKPGGQAIHLMRVQENIDENPVHKTLLSPKGNYKFSQFPDKNRLKLKYTKTISP